jgi:hypothetical protein
MRRTLTLISVLALMTSLLALPAAASTLLTTYWTGGGSDSVVACEEDQDPYLHWILTSNRNFAANNTPLLYPGGAGPAVEGSKVVGAAHFYTYDSIPYDEETGMPDLSAYEGTYATFVQGRSGTVNSNLVISDGCYDAPLMVEGQIDVVKTVDTSFAREHDWSIEKRVDPESITLSAENLSEEATWYVDVTYEGYGDEDIKVYGTIEVSWSGNVTARIDSVTDLVTQGVVDTPAVVDCGDPDPFPVYLNEDNPLLECTYEAELASIADGENVASAEGEFIEPDEPFVAPPGFDWDIDVSGGLDGGFPALVEFGDPDPDKHATAYVTDTNDGFLFKYDAGEHILSAYDEDGDPLAEGTKFEFDYSETFEFCEDDCQREVIENTAEVRGDMVEGVRVLLDSATATLTINKVCEFDGCTPGFWKNDTPANRPAWNYLDEEFGIDRDTLLPGTTLTLEEALASQGSSSNLYFHGAAGWLNAHMADNGLINYRYSVAEVEAIIAGTGVYEGLTMEARKNLLDYANNEGECPFSVTFPVIE